MKCPLCCEFVPNEDQLQDHYLTMCSGLADESDEDITSSKKKIQYISSLTTDKEIYFLSNFLENAPQITLVKVSDDLYQSEEMNIPIGTFEGQLVIGEDVLSVAPFSTATSIITLRVTKQEFDTWSVHSSKSSLSSKSKSKYRKSSAMKASLSMSSLGSQQIDTASEPESGHRPKNRRRTLSDQSSVSPKDVFIKDIVLSDSSVHYSDQKHLMAERTSSKDSIDKFKPTTRRKRTRHLRRFQTNSLSSSSFSSAVSHCSSTVASSAAVLPNPLDMTADRTLIGADLSKELVKPLLDSDTEKEVQDLKAEISKLRIENRKQAKELSTLSKVIDGPLAPQTESEIVKRENLELKQELSELRNVMLRQERNHNKKIENYKLDPVDDWKKNQIDKLQRQLLETEQKVDEAKADKMRAEEELLKAKDKICQLRDTRDTLRNTNDNINNDMKKVTEKLEEEISELHQKYLAQSRNLETAEKESQAADHMRGMVERLTIENEELVQKNLQLSVQTADFESMVDKLKNKIGSLEIELEYKNKRNGPDIQEQEESVSISPYKSAARYRDHPLTSAAKSDTETYHSVYTKPVKSHLTFNDDDLYSPTADKKTEPRTDTNRNAESVYSTELKENGTDFRSKYAGGYSYSKTYTPTVKDDHEDDTYREALAIVEKYKKMDLNAEKSKHKDDGVIPKCTTKWDTGPIYNGTSTKSYDGSKSYDRSLTDDKDSVGAGRDVYPSNKDRKWNYDDNYKDYNSNGVPSDKKPWSSTAWLRHNTESERSNYDVRNNYASPGTTDYTPATGTLTKPIRNYGDGLRSSYCGRSYNVDFNKSKVHHVTTDSDADDETEEKPRAKSATKAPQSASDLQLGNRVVFKRGSELERGNVRYIGRLIGKDGQYVGLELGNNTGNHDGTYQGHTYFKCKPKRGVFIPVTKVQLVYP